MSPVSHRVYKNNNDKMTVGLWLVDGCDLYIDSNSGGAPMGFRFQWFIVVSNKQISTKIWITLSEMFCKWPISPEGIFHRKYTNKNLHRSFVVWVMAIVFDNLFYLFCPYEAFLNAMFLLSGREDLTLNILVFVVYYSV